MTIARNGALVLCLVVAGCSLLPGGGSTDLAGREFLSTAVTVGGAAQPLVDGTQIHLSFSDEGGLLSAAAGCNTFAALYRIDGGVLSTSDGAMTEIGCEPDLMAQDDWLFGLLGAQPAVTLSGEELELVEGNTVITLVDREVADPDLPLIGPIWSLTSIITGDAAASAPDGVVATLVFTEDGLVMVNTGCNSGSGPAEIRASTIVFGELAMTRMACQGEAALVERAMLQVLSADLVRYSVDASLLELSIGGSGLQLTGTGFE